MARKLMPFGDNAPDQLGMTLRHPTEGEERCLDAGVTEDAEHLLGIGLDAARPRIPACAINGAREGLDLKIILDVDRHGVADRRAVGGCHRPLWRGCRFSLMAWFDVEHHLETA